MRIKFRFVILFFIIFLKLNTSCFSQKIDFSVLNYYENTDSIFFKISILAKDSLIFPSECELFEIGIDINPMFTLFECQQKGKNSYKNLRKIGYDLNSVYLYLVDSVKSKKYECESIISSMDFKKNQKYRVRFIIHFERFNFGVSMYKSNWFYFKT
jgi:hypothetical protein